MICLSHIRPSITTGLWSDSWKYTTFSFPVKMDRLNLQRSPLLPIPVQSLLPTITIWSTGQLLFLKRLLQFWTNRLIVRFYPYKSTFLIFIELALLTIWLRVDNNGLKGITIWIPARTIPNGWLWTTIN